MRAIQVRDGTLLLLELETPSALTENEVLIEVAASAVNRADLLQARGKYPPPPGASDILGLECSGTIVARGASVRNWQVGDQCMALLPGGAYADQVIADQGSLLPIPAACSLEDAAAIPEVFLTVYLNLFQIAGVQRGDRVLVHAGASGIGTAAIQMLKHKGIAVAVTAGNDEKCTACLNLGADYVINYRKEQFDDVLLDRFGAVDVILDCVGADYFKQNCSILRPDGRLVLIGCMSGSQSEISLAQLIGKRLQIIGSTLRARSNEFKAALITAFQADFFQALDQGQIKPLIDRRFTLADVAEAHAYMQSSLHIGKLLLQNR